MGVFSNLDAVLGELGRLGFKAEGFLRDDDGNPGAVVIGRGSHAGAQRVFTTSQAVLEDEAQSTEWAQVVASLASEVDA
jgi:hypothetical protein